VLRFLAEHDLGPFDHELLLRREIYATGRSRAFINDSPVQVALLQQIGDLMVDLHGQHEHQSLLKINNHLLFLDAFGGLEEERTRVAAAFQALAALRGKRQSLLERQSELLARRELFVFQLAEIEKVNPQPDEEDALLQQEKIVRSAERLFSLTDQNYRLVYEQEDSVYNQLSRVFADLVELRRIDARFDNALKECESAKLLVEELAGFFRDYRSKIDFSPDNVEQLQTRIAQLSGLKKRFGCDLRTVVERRQELQAQLAALDNFDLEIDKLDQEIVSATEIFASLCLGLSKGRKRAAAELESHIPAVLSHLGMPASRFNVVLQYQHDPNGTAIDGRTYQTTANGMDIAEFVISTNAGEQMKPLAKVASGGEISRIMLALKSTIAREGQMPTLLFDEIDSGISGRIASTVGKQLKALSRFHQVLCITHLPQIASMGRHHWFVEKQTLDGRTVTRFRKLNAEERTQEIAKLLAGEKLSDAHLNSARELLQEAALD
jgi:DNA repair protein RecN (Recombination protein N)